LRNRKRKKRTFTKHHIKNVINGGTSNPKNLILLNIEKHICWHRIFHNLDFKQAAELLLRADKIKRSIKNENNR
jgi:hypothetical protein